MKKELKEIFFHPFLSLLLRQKSLCLVLLIGSGILLFFQILNIKIWFCPFYKFTGLDCPGCGMTRSMVAIFQGNFGQSLHLHPFAFFFVGGWLLLLVSIILPEKFHQRASERLEKFEKKTGIFFLLLFFFFLFGIARLIYEIYILV